MHRKDNGKTKVCHKFAGIYIDGCPANLPKNCTIPSPYKNIQCVTVRICCFFGAFSLVNARQKECYIWYQTLWHLSYCDCTPTDVYSPSLIYPWCHRNALNTDGEATNMPRQQFYSEDQCLTEGAPKISKLHEGEINILIRQSIFSMKYIILNFVSYENIDILCWICWIYRKALSSTTVSVRAICTIRLEIKGSWRCDYHAKVYISNSL